MSDDDLPGRVRLFGGEMPTWSDLDSGWAPVRRGAQLPVLLAALSGRKRVLVAGPHEPDLLTSVADAVDGEVTCLVRSIPDARLLGEAFDAVGEGSRVRVVCGSLERYDEGGYDAVVALDDVGRLYSTEGPEPAFSTALADLRRLLAPDGVLVIMVDNELGVDWLTAQVQPEADQSEPAWSRPFPADDTRPRGLAELAERFGSGAVVWPVYPLPSAPVVAWGPAAGSVDRTEYAGLFAALSDSAARSLEDARPAADVASLMRRVWRAGRLPEFAAGWLVVAGAPGGGSAGGAEPAAERDEVAWLAADQGEPVPVRLAGGRPVGPDGSPVPTGRLLSDVLMQAVVAPDQAALRAAIRGYADWLATLADVTAAGADYVVVTDGGEHLPLAFGVARLEPPAETADEHLLAAAADLVRRVEQHGYRRTWPSHLTPTEAVAWVAAMRGQPFPDELVQRVAAAVGLDRPLAPAGAVPPAVAVATERFEESNASRARWFETRLKTAEKQLATAWGEADKARGQNPGQSAEPMRLMDRLKTTASRTETGRRILVPLRRGKRLARRVVHRVRR